jgi:hypothetical protein
VSASHIEMSIVVAARGGLVSHSNRTAVYASRAPISTTRSHPRRCASPWGINTTFTISGG